MLRYILTIFLSFYIAFSSCHNRLISPTPWSPTPTKYPPCGGGVSLTAPQAYWYSGSTASIVWDVVGDGIGPVNISIDPTGSTNFNRVIVSNSSTAVLGLNTITFTVPDEVTCTGVNSTCSIQVFSTSGWSECTSVTILPPCTNCTPEVPPGPTCQTAVGLQFCSQYNNTKILLGAGFNAAALDLMVNQSLYEYSYLMPTFLVNGTTPECQKVFKEYLCGIVFPACDGKVQTCASICNSFNTSCGLNPTHAALYNCSAVPQNCGGGGSSGKTDEFIIIFTGSAIVAVIVVAFVLNFIVRRRYSSGYTAIQ